MPRPNLDFFLDWLEGRGVQVICCGYQGRPLPIAGEMPHDWLRAVAQQPSNYYEEEEVDHRAKDPFSRPSKSESTSRLKVRDRAQKLLFERNDEYFPDTAVPLLYRPEDTRRQNIMIVIPGPSPDGRPNQQELNQNDVVEVPLKYMSARSSAASGARTRLLAMTSQSTRAKVSPLQTRKRSELSMLTFSGRILPTWPYQEWSISASSSGWYASRGGFQ